MVSTTGIAYPGLGVAKETKPVGLAHVASPAGTTTLKFIFPRRPRVRDCAQREH